MIGTTIAALLIITYIIWHLSIYNSLTNAHLATQQAWSNVEVELKRRLDLISNLSEVVRGYAKYEADTLEKVVKSRLSTCNISNAANAKQNQAVTGQALASILALAESYPEIKANEQFKTLQQELTNTENRIATARKIYNQNVSAIQNLCNMLPSSVIAWVHEFESADFFDISDEEANASVDINFQQTGH